MAIVAGLLLLASAALAQDAAPRQAPAEPPATRDLAVPAEPLPPAAQPAPARRPGLFEAIGRWFDEGGSSLRNHLRGAKDRVEAISDEAAHNSRELGDTAVEATKDAVEVTKGAVGAVARLPATRVMKGHERCAVAPNGAPDCVAAADALCRKQGFSSGKSMDFTSAEECPTQVYLSGRQTEADCATVTFISRAMCQ